MQIIKKKCPKCGRPLVLAYKTPKGIIEHDISEKKPANVWACHDPCYYDEPLKKENDKEK